MRFKTTLKASANLIDLTPLVDVIFLMLIFFIVTSDILPLKSLNIESPVLEADSMPLTTRLPVIMDAQNVIYVGSKKEILDFDTLKSHLSIEIAKLKARHPGSDPTVVLSVDRQVEYGIFLRLFGIVQETSPKLRLAYRPADQEENE